MVSEYTKRKSFDIFSLTKKTNEKEGLSLKFLIMNKKDCPLIYFLSVNISFAAPKLLRALVASKGIKILLASPFATSSRASRDFSWTSLSSGLEDFIAL